MPTVVIVQRVPLKYNFLEIPFCIKKKRCSLKMQMPNTKQKNAAENPVPLAILEFPPETRVNCILPMNRRIIIIR